MLPSTSSGRGIPQIRRDFAARVQHGNLGPDVTVIYRVDGGMPSQRVQSHITVDSVAGARVELYDARFCPTPTEAAIPAHELDVSKLFERVSAGMHSLLPASRAAFSPDALVGSLTIRIQDEEETFYFIPEQEKRKRQGNGLALPMERALEQFGEIVRRVMATQKDATYA